MGKQGQVAQRVAAVGAGVLLAGSIWTGTAAAQIPGVGDDTTTTSASSTTTSAASTTTSAAGGLQCSLVPTLLQQYNALAQGLPIPGLPTGTPVPSITDLANQLNALIPGCTAAAGSGQTNAVNPAFPGPPRKPEDFCPDPKGKGKDKGHGDKGRGSSSGGGGGSSTTTSGSATSTASSGTSTSTTAPSSTTAASETTTDSSTGTGVIPNVAGNAAAPGGGLGGILPGGSDASQQQADVAAPQQQAAVAPQQQAYAAPQQQYAASGYSGYSGYDQSYQGGMGQGAESASGGVGNPSAAAPYGNYPAYSGGFGGFGGYGYGGGYGGDFHESPDFCGGGSDVKPHGDDNKDYGQVNHVPSGSVNTGDGSTDVVERTAG